jgi:CHAT domain-containing protein
VLRNEGIAAAIDLGEATAIDRQVERFRGALSRPAHRDTRAAARTLHQAVMAPIAASLRDVPRIIVSPDGALNLIPFAALVGADDKYLVEHFTISYMTSGRDLVRFAEAGRRPRATGPPSIVANPSFGSLRTASVALPDGPGATRAVPAPSELQRGLRFVPLPGTAQEAAALAKMLPDARVYTGSDANEGLLKRLSAPSILHIASHGFFLRPRAAPRGTTSGREANAPAPVDADREDALVLSGLALAGANERGGSKDEDGILTALEVVGLDLWGTRMVVLSACETGLGDARNGEEFTDCGAHSCWRARTVRS